MSEKKKTKTTKLKNFLVTGSTEMDGEEYEYDAPPNEEELVIEEEEMMIEDPMEEEIPEEVCPEAAIPFVLIEEPIDTETEEELRKEIAELKDIILSLKTENEKYLTSKEQMKEYSAIVNRRDSELANRKLMGLLEQLSAMREDFFKLCKGINTKVDKFSASDVLSSFEAYGVDMENILTDCGVYIGKFNYERLNTIHQRIVDVIPTDDESMNGMIAERVSDGYEYSGRVLCKEKVNIYKFSEKIEKKGDE
jgi:GrpE.